MALRFHGRFMRRKLIEQIDRESARCLLCGKETNNTVIHFRLCHPSEFFRATWDLFLFHDRKDEILRKCEENGLDDLVSLITDSNKVEFPSVEIVNKPIFQCECGLEYKLSKVSSKASENKISS